MTRSRARKLLIFFAALAGLAALIISFSSILGITELVYPVRIDSAYVVAMQRNSKGSTQDSIDPSRYLYKPEQLALGYENLSVQTNDSLELKGWYFPPFYEELGITILIIHDINESKISYLQAAKAFSERGFRVCCMDMRGCGASEGEYFTMGTVTSTDISNILNRLYARPETKHIALMGSGTGAAIAIQSFVYDQRPIALVAQNSFASLTAYYSRFARIKWGILGRWFFPLMKKELDAQTGFNSDSLNLQKMILRVTKPTLFVARAKESIDDLKETHLLFELSPSAKKEFVFFRDKAANDTLTEPHKAYYDKISAFISTSVPKKEIRTRFRKLVLNDHKVNH